MFRPNDGYLIREGHDERTPNRSGLHDAIAELANQVRGRVVRWGREVYAALEPFATSAEYLNFPGTSETPERSVRGTFGATLERLVEVKRQYDPDNIFRINANIDPAW